MKTLKLVPLALSFAFTRCLSWNAVAASQAVWHIGTLNQSSSGFNGWKDGSKGEWTYLAGKSIPGTDWPAQQEGSDLGKAGSRTHPYSIQFDLEEVPQGHYSLKIALQSETARVAELEVEINDIGASIFNIQSFPTRPTGT